jgi:hypothetical protein
MKKPKTFQQSELFDRLTLRGEFTFGAGLAHPGEPCGALCTNAVGSSCDCACRGVCHGMGRCLLSEIRANDQREDSCISVAISHGGNSCSHRAGVPLSSAIGGEL